VVRKRIRVRTLAAIGLCLGATAFLGLVSISGAATSASCSKATAAQLVEQHHLNAFLLPNPVQQVLCGPFTGRGSEAMAITIGAPTCWGTQRWGVFSFTGGTWQLVLDQREFIFPLVVVGADIREMTPVFRQGDPRCIPSGGTHARLWHWNGKRLVAGPWKQVTAGTGTATTGAITTAIATSGYFKTPSANIVCFYAGASPGPAHVVCGIKSGLKPAPPRLPCTEGGYAGDRVDLFATGRTHVPSCAGDPGPFTGLVVGARVLGYGTTWSGDGLRCTSATTGLTCRNKSGHGFFLSRERWRSF
jgi:hypothetical protein